jgi:hypothetical protein
VYFSPTIVPRRDKFLNITKPELGNACFVKKNFSVGVMLVQQEIKKNCWRR